MEWVKNRNSYKIENENKTLVASLTPHYKDCQKVPGLFDVGITKIYPDGAYEMRAIRRIDGIRGLANAKKWCETWLPLIEKQMKTGGDFISKSESL